MLVPGFAPARQIHPQALCCTILGFVVADWVELNVRRTLLGCLCSVRVDVCGLHSGRDLCDDGVARC